MSGQKENNRGKVLSVRLSNKEAKDFESRAKASGLNRSEYVRLCLSGTDVSIKTDQLFETVEALRQIVQVFDRYLDILEELLQTYREDGNGESIAHIMEEISRAEALMDLCLKTQKQIANVLKSIRRKTPSAERSFGKAAQKGQ